jgi:hypothetical protein
MTSAVEKRLIFLKVLKALLKKQERKMIFIIRIFNKGRRK